eukprot:1153225-Pelagomonas_calceolata.AAC.4
MADIIADATSRGRPRTTVPCGVHLWPQCAINNTESDTQSEAMWSCAAILAIGGAGFAASKVDSGFSEWINESGALVRQVCQSLAPSMNPLHLQKSDNWGGFEEDIKETYPYVPDGVFPSKGGGGAKKTCLKLGSYENGIHCTALGVQSPRWVAQVASINAEYYRILSMVCVIMAGISMGMFLGVEPGSREMHMARLT